LDAPLSMYNTLDGTELVDMLLLLIFWTSHGIVSHLVTCKTLYLTHVLGFLTFFVGLLGPTLGTVEFSYV